MSSFQSNTFGNDKKLFQNLLLIDAWQVFISKTYARYTISGTKGSESRDMVDSIWIRYEETSKHT